MAVSSLDKAVADALSMSGELDGLFAKIGNSDHPRGVIPTAYRNARRAMRSALKERNRAMAAHEIMSELKQTVRAGLKTVLENSFRSGTDHAAVQLGIYGTAPKTIVDDLFITQVNSSYSGILSVVDQQASAIQTVISLNMDTDHITGDEHRVGIMRAGDVIASATFWASALLWSAFSETVARSTDTNRAKKLVVAAIDRRTTDCCLRAHGQVQAFNKPFVLTGTPRYADKLDWTPFHNYCRTSVALYYDEYDNGVTDSMREKAQMAIERMAKTS